MEAKYTPSRVEVYVMPDNRIRIREHIHSGADVSKITLAFDTEQLAGEYLAKLSQRLRDERPLVAYAAPEEEKTNGARNPTQDQVAQIVREMAKALSKLEQLCSV